MPPLLALSLTGAFICWLLARESREKPEMVQSLRVPLVWLLLIGSRPPSQWLSLRWSLGASNPEEGTPIDAAVFLVLITAGVYTLKKRNLRIQWLFAANLCGACYLLYCLVATSWSDFPLIALKRWFKMLGNPVMALVVLSAGDPVEAIKSLIRRWAYVLIPLSITFIKYFPDLGRGWDDWTGAAFNMGVTTSKNGLGCVCMVSGLFFFWNLLKTLQGERTKDRRNEILLSIAFLYMIAWLLKMAHCSTALVALAAGLATMVFLGLPWANRRSAGAYLLAGAVCLVLAELTFGISSSLVGFVGRDSTLTGRTGLWNELLAFRVNRFFGAGFESFWLGKRLEKLWEVHWWQPNQAHNGYLETYLNLGAVGVLLLGLFMFAAFRKINIQLLERFELARFRLSVLAAIACFNWTEAGLKGIHLVWFLFFLIAFEVGYAIEPVSGRVGDYTVSGPEAAQCTQPATATRAFSSLLGHVQSYFP